MNFIYGIFGMILLLFECVLSDGVNSELKSDDEFVIFLKNDLKKYQNGINKDEIYQNTNSANCFIFEAHLGVLCLMKNNWNCEKKVVKKGNEEICKKYNRYMLFLYEYVIRVYYEAQQPDGKKSLYPPDVPIFTVRDGKMVTLMEALNSLSMIACFLFDPKCNEAYSDNFELLLESWPDPTIENCSEMPPAEKKKKKNKMRKHEKNILKAHTNENHFADNKAQTKAIKKEQEDIKQLMERMSKIAKIIKPKQPNYAAEPQGIWKCPFFLKNKKPVMKQLLNKLHIK